MEAKKEKKITMPLATALAEQVVDGIKTVKAEVMKRKKNEFIKSKEYQKLVIMNRKSVELYRELEAFEKKLEKDFDVEISRYDNKVSVNDYCRYIGDKKRFRLDIIAANHMHGIPVDQVVNHVIKQELNRKTTPCD